MLLQLGHVEEFSRSMLLMLHSSTCRQWKQFSSKRLRVVGLQHASGQLWYQRW